MMRLQGRPFTPPFPPPPPPPVCAVVSSLQLYVALAVFPQGSVPNWHFDDSWPRSHTTAVPECFSVLHITVLTPVLDLSPTITDSEEESSGRTLLLCSSDCETGRSPALEKLFDMDSFNY